MSKAVEGAALLGASAIGLAAITFATGGLGAIANTMMFAHIVEALAVGGVSMEAGAIAGALTSNRGMNITTRQPASFRQIIYGEQRVGGVEIYRSTTGSHHDQFNYIIVLAGHEIESIVNLYLDGRQVYWDGTGPGYTTRNGVAFGGNADGSDHTGPNGTTYNFGGKVYCEARFGDQSPGDVIGAMTANDPHWTGSGGSTPWVGGCAYVYLKIEYDATMFPGEPEIRFTVRGKNNIADPRTGTAGYSTNWALIVGDVLTDTEFGLGDPAVNQAQLIAAANVCDEQVAIGIGGTESRYTCHWHYDTSTSPGDALQTIMTAAAGRLSQINGEWYIWPAYWQGSSFSFNESHLTGSFEWMPCRSYRELFNRVTGTYTAPNYPYSTAGDLYDANGWYNGMLANNFPFAFQPTNYPQYAADTLHGYPSDAYLTEDGRPLPKEISQPCVLSISQAQRVAKIMLMRNRQQGTGTFTMSLAAWQMQPVDVFNFTFAANGWTNKVLEVNSVGFKIDKGNDGAPLINVQFTVNETDASVYTWSIAEELTVYDVPSSPTGISSAPLPPTSLVVISSALTAIVGADGIVRPRAEVSWTFSLDGFTTQQQVQYQLSSAGTVWTDWGSVGTTNNFVFVDNVVAGQSYNFRVRALRSNGAPSPWLTSSSPTVISNTLSTTSSPVAPSGTLIASAFTGGAAEIDVNPFTATVGSLTASCLSSLFSITGLNQSQLYYVYYTDPTFSGGSITPVATQNVADFDGRVGYYLIGSLITPSFSSGGGSRYSPSSFADVGTRSTVTPAAAYDGDVTSDASVSGNWTLSSSTIGECIWQGFPHVVTTAVTTLNVLATITSSGISCNISAKIGSSTPVTLISTTSSAASATYTMSIPSGTDLSTVSTTVTVDGTIYAGGGTLVTANIKGFEIWIQ